MTLKHKILVQKSDSNENTVIISSPQIKMLSEDWEISFLKKKSPSGISPEIKDEVKDDLWS